MPFDIEAARKEGYSDDEILQHLTQSRKFDIEGARKEGYSNDELIAYLSGAPQAKAARNEGMGRPPGPPDESFGARFAEGATRGLLSGGPLMDMGRELMDPETLKAMAGGPGAMALHQLGKIPGMLESLTTPEGLGNAVAGLPYMLLGAEYAPEGMAATKGAASEVARYAPKAKAAGKGAVRAWGKPRTWALNSAGNSLGYLSGEPLIGSAVGAGIPMAIDAVKAWKATPKTPLKPPALPEPPPMLAREPVVVPEPPPGPWSASGSTTSPEATRPTPGPTGPLPNMTGALPRTEVPKPPGTPSEQYASHPSAQHDTVKVEKFHTTDTDRFNAMRQARPTVTKQELTAITDPATQREMMILMDKNRKIKNPRHELSEFPGKWERFLLAIPE